MKKIPLNREVILDRIRIIEKSLSKLARFKDMSLEDFKSGENFAIAEHYLRRTLEAVFDIGNHIISRIPGEKASSYREIAIILGRYNIVSEEFARDKLVRMAGYRNRLIHFYSEITEEEMYNIIQANLLDIEEFISALKILLEKPEKYGFSII
ncbi:MAG: DUF86 domain-containing protein [bacterium]|nr:DUF86 domain-containing protein [bacterium]